MQDRSGERTTEVQLKKEENMRKYAALYNSEDSSWSLIYKDDTEEAWYIFLRDAGNGETATLLADAMNNRHR